MRGKNLNVIQSMYRNIKSKVKYNNSLSSDFTSYAGVRQEEGDCVPIFIEYVHHERCV